MTDCFINPAVEEILDRWLSPQRRYFKIRADDVGVRRDAKPTPRYVEAVREGQEGGQQA